MFSNKVIILAKKTILEETMQNLEVRRIESNDLTNNYRRASSISEGMLIQ